MLSKFADEAEPFLRECLLAREGWGRAAAAETAGVLLELGWLLQDRQQLPEAEALLRRCVAIREKAFGSQHPEVAKALIGHDCSFTLRWNPWVEPMSLNTWMSASNVLVFLS